MSGFIRMCGRKMKKDKEILKWVAELEMREKVIANEIQRWKYIDTTMKVFLFAMGALLLYVCV